MPYVFLWKRTVRNFKLYSPWSLVHWSFRNEPVGKNKMQWVFWTQHKVERNSNIKPIAPHQSCNLRFLPILVTDRHRGDLHEGDIKLTHAQRRMLGLPVQRGKGGRQKRAAMKSLTRRWMDSNGQPVIPYRIEGSVGEWQTGNLSFKKFYHWAGSSNSISQP